MTDDTQPAKHIIGNFAEHPAWEPAPIRIPDDPGIGVHVTNTTADDQASVMRAYVAMYPDADFSIGAPKATDKRTVSELTALNIIGIYANRKRNG